MKTNRFTQAKIVNHDSGMGTPNSGTVRRRATELARIAGRSRFTEEDWRQAKLELHGGQSFADAKEEDLAEGISGRDMIATDTGHHVENIPVEDADNIVEELISEGMDEAVHEQMLEASKLESVEEDE